MKKIETKKKNELLNLIVEEAKNLYNNPHYKFVEGDELYIYDDDYFPDTDEVDMNFKYADGIAVNDDCTYALVYQRKCTLTEMDRTAIRLYDGIPAPREYTYRDIALWSGILIKLTD